MCKKLSPFKEFMLEYHVAKNAEEIAIMKTTEEHNKQVKHFVKEYADAIPQLDLDSDGKTLRFELETKDNKPIEFKDGMDVHTVVFKNPCYPACDLASADTCIGDSKYQHKLTLRDSENARLLVRKPVFDAFNGTMKQHAESKKEENMKIMNVFTPETYAKITEKLAPGNYDVFFKLACDGKAHPDFTPSGRYTHHEAQAGTSTLPDIFDLEYLRKKYELNKF